MLLKTNHYNGLIIKKIKKKCVSGRSLPLTCSVSFFGRWFVVARSFLLTQPSSFWFLFPLVACWAGHSFRLVPPLVVRSLVFTPFGRSQDIMNPSTESRRCMLYFFYQLTSHCYSAGCLLPRKRVGGWVSSKQLYLITSSSPMSAVRGCRLNSISRLSSHLL